jgi:hypothetical protein
MNDQEDRIAAVAEEVTQDEQVTRDPSMPVMPFPTAYVLSREQEIELCEFAKRRITDIENEMGREYVSDNTWGSIMGGLAETPNPENLRLSQRTWLGKRIKYDLMSRNEVEYRAYLEMGIFSKSNLVLPLSRRIWRQMAARGNSYFFSTQPFFSAEAVGQLDRVKADKANRYAQWKLDRSKIASVGHSVIDRAFAIGECVTKTVHEKDDRPYQQWAVVLTDEAGENILTSQGDVILETDVWIPQIAVNEATGEQFETGNWLLQKDPSIMRPLALVWTEKLIWRKKRYYCGPKSTPIHFLDFICPLEAESLEQADFIAHQYDKPMMEIVDQWRKADEASAATIEKIEATKEAISILAEVSQTGSPDMRQKNVDPTLSDVAQPASRSSNTSMVRIAECYLRYDINGDGILEDIMLVMDKATGTPIFYDYLQNVTPDGKRPFTCVRALEVPNRWYGIGTFEIFDKAQEYCDLTLNRMNHAASKEGRVDFWQPHNTVEGAADGDLKMNWGGTYTLKNGKTAQDCLQSVYLQDNKMEGLRELLNMQTQMAMQESGVQNTNDGQLAGMDSTKLATGIRNIEASGQEIFGSYIHQLEIGIQDLVRKQVATLFANLDEMEVYRYFEENEGGEGVGKLLEIDPKEISDMDLDVTILLSRYKGEQIIANSNAVIETINAFYAQPPEIQSVTAPAFQDILKALQVTDYDKRIVPMAISTMQPSQGPNVNPSTATSKPKQMPPNV